MVEPKKVFEALEDYDWVQAMHEELNNFKRDNVWELVEKPKDCLNVIGTKWVSRFTVRRSPPPTHPPIRVSR